MPSASHLFAHARARSAEISGSGRGMLREAAGVVHNAIKRLVFLLALVSPYAEAAHPPPLSIASRAVARRPGRAHVDRHSRTLLGQLSQARSILSVAARPSKRTDAPLLLTVPYPSPFRGPSRSFTTYVARVHHDLLVFQAIPIDSNPLLRTGSSLVASPKMGFWRAPQAEDLLALYRQRDRLLYFRDMPLDGAQLATGLGMFVAAALLSAHAPRPLRILFDRSFHLGPAVFDRSGMGIGFGGQFR